MSPGRLRWIEFKQPHKLICITDNEFSNSEPILHPLCLLLQQASFKSRLPDLVPATVLYILLSAMEIMAFWNSHLQEFARSLTYAKTQETLFPKGCWRVNVPLSSLWTILNGVPSLLLLGGFQQLLSLLGQNSDHLITCNYIDSLIPLNPF